MRQLTAFACMTLAAAVHSQNTFVVPSANTSQTGNNYDYFTFYSATPSQQPVHIQLVYSTSDIRTTSGVLRALNLRRANAIGNANPAATATLSIDLSVGPNNAAATSATFAANLGANSSTVFNGNINLPADPYSGPNPAPFALQIPFTLPFPYAQALGQGLVADIKVALYTPPTVGTNWWLDSHGIEGGARASNGNAQSTCKFSNGNYNNSISYPTYRYPGSVWYVSYGSILPNAPGVGAIGNVGVGQSWGGIPLPISLASLGAPGCTWNTNILISVGLLANASGSATWPNIPIPNDASLANAAFFDHALFLDPAANAAGIVTTWSSKWTIGSGNLPEGSQVYKFIDNPPSPTGAVRRQAVIAQFVY